MVESKHLCLVDWNLPLAIIEEQLVVGCGSGYTESKLDGHISRGSAGSRLWIRSRS